MVVVTLAGTATYSHPVTLFHLPCARPRHWQTVIILFFMLFVAIIDVNM